MSTIKGATLARLRRTLQRSVKDGWVRSVFAEPGSTDPGEVAPGPGAGVVPSAADVDKLLDAAQDAAKRGLVKQTLVLDDRTRVRIDARFGKAKIQRLDEDKIAKVMGGKQRPLRPDESGALLRAIGIMNPDGSVSAKNAKKYKQVNHLVELCRPAWERHAGEGPLRVLDLGCGNSYLTFVMAEALRLEERAALLHGVDAREDVITRSRERAAELGMSNLSFEIATIRDADFTGERALGGPPDLVVALHACDTATDEAIARAVHAGTTTIFCAPCCQRELANQLSVAPVSAVLQQGLLRRDSASTLTDAIRVELLEACGYSVDTVEFVTSSHTPKNLLIRAHRRDTGAPVDPSRWRLQAIVDACNELRIRPTALTLLQPG